VTGGGFAGTALSGVRSSSTDRGGRASPSSSSPRSSNNPFPFFAEDDDVGSLFELEKRRKKGGEG
jgi:hypothetical protein